MRLTSPWLWAGLVMLVGLSLINSRGFTASENRPGDMGEPFVRIGNHYINKHRIDYIVGEDDSLVIVFASGGGNRLRLAGRRPALCGSSLSPVRTSKLDTEAIRSSRTRRSLNPLLT